MTIGPSGSGDFVPLVEKGGSPRILRTIPGAGALAGRERRRGSLAYFAQLTHFELADEEAPARVEFADRDPSGTASAAWRPQEAFQRWAIDYSIRQLNRFTAASPHPQAGARRAQMDFAPLTGDNSDNQQRNETIWVRKLVEGGQTLTPGSGTSSFANTSCTPADQAALGLKYPNLAQEAANYTGVQDYADYGGNTQFYDPDAPAGPWAGWPPYTGLMERAQRPFVPVGLRRGSIPVPIGGDRVLVALNQAAVVAVRGVGTSASSSSTPPRTGHRASSRRTTRGTRSRGCASSRSTPSPTAASSPTPPRATSTIHSGSG